MSEVWKDITGYEGLYQISSFGRIKRDDRILNPYLNNKGYYYITLSKNNIPKNKLIHRIIAEAFIPNPDNKPCIDHINRKPSDNSISNLRWVTIAENSQNCSLRIDNTLREQNICYDKIRDRYAFQITKFKKAHRKYFKTLEEAKEYRDEYLIENKM